MAVIWTSVVGAICVFWFGMFLTQSGVDIRNNKIKGYLSMKRRYDGEKSSYIELLRIFGVAVGIRIAVYILSAIAITIYSDNMTFSFSDFITNWTRWDAEHYINLAKMGYSDYIDEGRHIYLVFFPLYPWLLRGVHLFVRNYQVAALTLSTLSFGVGACFFYEYIAEEYGKSIAFKSFILLSVYPFGFYFGAMMTESLFFCTMSAGFLMIKRHNWVLTGVIGLLCSLCRVQGVLLLGVAGVEFFVYYRPFEMIKAKRTKELMREIFTKGIYLLLIPVGCFIYLYLNYKVDGNPFQFTVYQSECWYHNTTYFTNSLKEICGHVFSNDTNFTFKMCIWIPEFVLFVVSIGAIIYAIRRHPLKNTAFLMVYILVNYSVTFLMSGARYMCCALTLFIVVAEFLDRRPKLYSLVICCLAVLFGIYMTAFFLGRQVM